VKPLNGALQVVGPKSQDGSSDPDYMFAITLLGVNVSIPMDEWGFDRMSGELAARQAQSDSATGYLLVGAGSFHTGAGDVFQIDWFGAGALLRELDVAPKGGGPVVEVDARLPTDTGNPSQSPAGVAMTLLLHTLRSGGTLPSAGYDSLYFLDPFAGYSLFYPLTWSVGATEGYGATFRTPPDGPTRAAASVLIVPLAGVTIDQAAAGAAASGDVLADERLTLGGLPARRITSAGPTASARLLDYFVQLPAGGVIDVHIAGQTDAAGMILKSFGAYP
jgi:hypothetical protein